MVGFAVASRIIIPPSPNMPYRGGLKGKWLAVFIEYAWPTRIDCVGSCVVVRVHSRIKE